MEWDLASKSINKMNDIETNMAGRSAFSNQYENLHGGLCSADGAARLRTDSLMTGQDDV